MGTGVPLPLPWAGPAGGPPYFPGGGGGGGVHPGMGLPGYGGGMLDPASLALLGYPGPGLDMGAGFGSAMGLPPPPPLVRVAAPAPTPGHLQVLSPLPSAVQVGLGVTGPGAGPEAVAHNAYADLLTQESRVAEAQRQANRLTLDSVSIALRSDVTVAQVDNAHKEAAAARAQAAGLAKSFLDSAALVGDFVRRARGWPLAPSVHQT
jgi:hypothetical protein